MKIYLIIKAINEALNFLHDKILHPIYGDDEVPTKQKKKSKKKK